MFNARCSRWIPLLATVLGLSAARAADASPTADELLAKQIQALGGKAALQKITSRVLQAQLSSPMMAEPGTLEASAKAPNKRYSALTLPGLGAIKEWINGKEVWSDTPGVGLAEKTGDERAHLLREAEFYRELRLKELYPTMKVTGKEKVGARETYVLEATPPKGSPERMYFDAQTGLLVRRDFEAPGVTGPTPVELDFEDYREVDGIKVPFVVRMPKPEIVQFTLTVREVKHNVALADALFERPAQ